MAALRQAQAGSGWGRCVMAGSFAFDMRMNIVSGPLPVTRSFGTRCMHPENAKRLAPAVDLPPLELLRSFEAAARTLSFTQAAGELFLTQSAVSRQIQQLEASLGVLLFERRHRALALTEAGGVLQRAVVESLERLRDATARVRAVPVLRQVAITCTPGFASLLAHSEAGALHGRPSAGRRARVGHARGARPGAQPPRPRGALRADRARHRAGAVRGIGHAAVRAAGRRRCCACRATWPTRRCSPSTCRSTARRPPSTGNPGSR